VSDARTELLARVRGALGDAPPPAPVPRGYRAVGMSDGADPVERFCERVRDYGAALQRLPAAELETAIAERCRALGVERLAVPAGAPWGVAGVEFLADDPPLDARTLDTIGAALTGCALAIAETGTLVLDGTGACGRRALTLVPDIHLCVVKESDVVATLPDAIARLAPAAQEGRPLTFVSGPSATSDIELERVEGVHGPRTLELFVVPS
jgi:L-lactate dehydrogenase complex protein LldG